ncbi:MAG: hypothetical protein M0R80_02155 [Proteobacteria bacterium]|jgi:hypothetical protein|nr:hypothetical protein [Pseudomonadota bacterium]
MNFRLFLEREEGAIEWDTYYPKWTPRQLGDRGMISAYVSNKHISIDQSPYHPMLKKALRILLRQKPHLANKPLDFDGWSPGTLQQFLYSSEPIAPKDTLPQFMYHGTSLHRWEHIKEDGLKPLIASGGEYGAEPMSAPLTNPNNVYLSATFGAATRLAAYDASKKGTGDVPVVLKINTKQLDPQKIRPDEESRATTWQKSLHGLNTIAYEGEIPPQSIELYKAWNQQTDKWENPGQWLEPTDFIAQQMLHRTGYKDIPNSTGKYKWAK